jgi:hypothetical protein
MTTINNNEAHLIHVGYIVIYSLTITSHSKCQCCVLKSVFHPSPSLIQIFKPCEKKEKKKEKINASFSKFFFFWVKISKLFSATLLEKKKKYYMLT